MNRMKFPIFAAALLLLNGCNWGWKGAEVVNVSSLASDGYPAFAKAPPVVDGQEAPPDIDENQYVIQPGDTLSIKFFFNPELNEADLIVRPDGHISLQLVHEVKAEGLTPAQLKALLEKKYAGQLKNPEIAVIVRSIREPYRIYVDGEVSRPGEFEIIGSLSVLQAIARAGGLKPDTAKKSDVKVIRRGLDGQAFVINIDLDKVLKQGDLSQDIRLLPYDILYVPRSFW
jgi:polysaccharide biosynthesis/export protein